MNNILYAAAFVLPAFMILSALLAVNDAAADKEDKVLGYLIGTAAVINICALTQL